MGVHGFWKHLEPIHQPKAPLAKVLQNKRLGIDAQALIHQKFMRFCASDLLRKNTKKMCQQVVHWIRKLTDKYNCQVILVFDGLEPAVKDQEMAQRSAKRSKSQQLARTLLALGDTTPELATKIYSQGMSLEDSFILDVVKAVKQAGVCEVDPFFAPYEGEAQLGYMSRVGEVHAVYTGDSDIFLFNPSCQVIRDIDFKKGTCDAYLPPISNNNSPDLADLELWPTKITFSIKSYEVFVAACVMAGCDFVRGERPMHIFFRALSAAVNKEDCDTQDVGAPQTMDQVLAVLLSHRSAAPLVRISELQRAVCAFFFSPILDRTTNTLRTVTGIELSNSLPLPNSAEELNAFSLTEETREEWSKKLNVVEQIVMDCFGPLPLHSADELHAFCFQGSFLNRDVDKYGAIGDPTEFLTSLRQECHNPEFYCDICGCQNDGLIAHEAHVNGLTHRCIVRIRELLAAGATVASSGASGSGVAVEDSSSSPINDDVETPQTQQVSGGDDDDDEILLSPPLHQDPNESPETDVLEVVESQSKVVRFLNFYSRSKNQGLWSSIIPKMHQPVCLLPQQHNIPELPDPFHIGHLVRLQKEKDFCFFLSHTDPKLYPFPFVHRSKVAKNVPWEEGTVVRAKIAPDKKRAGQFVVVNAMLSKDGGANSGVVAGVKDQLSKNGKMEKKQSPSTKKKQKESAESEQPQEAANPPTATNKKPTKRQQPKEKKHAKPAEHNEVQVMGPPPANPYAQGQATTKQPQRKNNVDDGSVGKKAKKKPPTRKEQEESN